jgi:uncharacterized protein YkwD
MSTALALLLFIAQTATHSEKKTLSGTGHALQCVTNSTEAARCQEVFTQLNQYRQSLGLSSLAYDFRLEECMTGHCHHMGQHRFFAHSLPTTDSTFSSELSQAGDPWKRAASCGTSANGENIAAGYTSATAVMNAWKGSPGHDSNMRNVNWTRVGVGYFYLSGSPYGHYWGQLFGVGSVTQSAHANAGGGTTPPPPPPPTTVAAPTLTRLSNYYGYLRVQIVNNAAGATVYYTTNGTEPTTSSSSFTGTSRLIYLYNTGVRTVKAKALLNGVWSSTTTGQFVY